MSDTIFFKLKLKRGRSPIEVFEKMAKSVKKKGATKNWTCEIDEEKESFSIDFGDGESEDFFLHFENRVADGFCKVCFPLEGELFEDEKKSEFKILLNMIYSARTSFSSMELTDDYGLAEDFMEGKIYKLKLRELTEDELGRAKRLYGMGYTAYTDFSLKLVYDYLEVPFDREYREYVNGDVSCSMFRLRDGEYLEPFIETMLYETAEYRDRGRIYLINDYYGELNAVWYSVWAVVSLMEQLVLREDDPNKWYGSLSVKEAQLHKYYKQKFLPMLDSEEDPWEKCILAYRLFVSSCDFCGLKYVGLDRVLLDYRRNLGEPASGVRFYRLPEADKIIF